MNTVNKDRAILRRLVESYGVEDVKKYVNHINETRGDNRSQQDLDAIVDSIIIKIAALSYGDLKYVKQEISDYVDNIMSKYADRHYTFNRYDSTDTRYNTSEDADMFLHMPSDMVARYFVKSGDFDSVEDAKAGMAEISQRYFNHERITPEEEALLVKAGRCIKAARKLSYPATASLRDTPPTRIPDKKRRIGEEI